MSFTTRWASRSSAYTIVELADRSDESTANERRGRLVVGPVNLRLGQQAEPLGWVAFLDYTDWKTGATSPLTVGFRMGPAAVYRYLSGPSFAPLDNYNLGQIFLILLAVIAGLFLIIQAVALVMGLSLARSITGSVHELFAGTERVRRGDFSHKIAIRSRDQLGELAGSFNSMTASIEDLLQRRRRRSGSSRSCASRAASRCRCCRKARCRCPACRCQGIASRRAKSAATTTTSCRSTTIASGS